MVQIIEALIIWTLTHLTLNDQGIKAMQTTESLGINNKQNQDVTEETQNTQTKSCRI